MAVDDSDGKVAVFCGECVPYLAAGTGAAKHTACVLQAVHAQKRRELSRLR